MIHNKDFLNQKTLKQSYLILHRKENNFLKVRDILQSSLRVKLTTRDMMSHKMHDIFLITLLYTKALQPFWDNMSHNLTDHVAYKTLSITHVIKHSLGHFFRQIKKCKMLCIFLPTLFQISLIPKKQNMLTNIISQQN